MNIHAQIIEKDGQKAFAVIPYDEFLRLRQDLEDYEDLADLRAAKDQEADAPTLTLAELRSAFGKE